MLGILKAIYKVWIALIKPSCTIKCKELGKSVDLGKHVTLGHGSFIFAKKIGDYTYINNYCHLDKNVISMGKFCSVALNCRIGLGGHPIDWVSTHAFTYSKHYGFVPASKTEEPFQENQETIIGNDVWIGANVTILAGVTVGDGAIIGAHSLVTEDVEPYSIVVGTPAKHVKYRHSEKNIELLQNSAWWDWDSQKLKKHVHLFNNVSKFVESL